MASGESHRRTLITKLSLRSEHDEQLLLDTINEWRDGCNIGSDLAWETCHTKSDVRKLVASHTTPEEYF